MRMPLLPSPLLLLVLAACPRGQGGPGAPAAAAHEPPVVAAAAQVAHDAGVASCRGDGDPFDQQALRARVSLLSSEALAGRAPGSEGDVAARAEIEARLRCLGLSSVEQQPFTDAAGRETANVIAILPGSDAALRDEVILVGAHHDHLGAPGGKRYPGANDNASGVTALLAVAQALAERPAAPRRTVVFVAFGAEESPGELGGSRHFAAHPPEGVALDRVVYVVNLDMVGSHDSKDVVYALGGFRGTPARALVAELAKAHPSLRVVFGAAGRGSDHQPFCDAGIPYLFFWTPDASCYHASCDEADRLDYPHMAEIAALAAELTVALADSTDDLAASREKLGCGGKR